MDKDTTPNLLSQDAVLSCIRCGLCLAVCPTYRETLNETDSPRGRVALARAQHEGRLSRSENYVDKFFRCLLCESCQNICPSGAQLAQILNEARGDAAAHQLLPERISALDRAIAQDHNISGDDNDGRLIWAENTASSPGGIDQPQAHVAYFVGCVGSFFPRSYNVPRAFVEILERAKVDYALLGGQEWCCGYPQFINGELALARETILHNVARVRALGARQVVFTCPSCYHIWTHVYPQVLGEDLDLELLHSTQFLDLLLQESRLLPGRLDMKVTYHDPCDLGRKSEVFDAPRRVLESIPGIELVEMLECRENSHCCGGGGNLESHAADLAGQVAGRRIQQAADTGASVLVSACQQCERTLSNAARISRIRLRVMDVSELLLRALDAQPE